MAKEERIKEVYLDDQAMDDYREYGLSTIEDRAIVGTFDGLKPVMRRVMWGMHKMGLGHKVTTVKAARIVGEVLGKFHPHGDQSVFQAAVAATQIPQPLIDGSDSNWGTMTSGAAAMRYINGRLTKYSDLVFFDKFYLPTMQFSSNFDSTEREPVNLVTLLPNGLLNGNFGICPGVNTRTPAFTMQSIVKVLKTTIAAKDKDKLKTVAEACKDLEWVSDYGGKLIKSKHNKQEMKAFLKTGIGSFDWESSYTVDDKTNTMRFNRFAPFSTNDKATQGNKSPLEKLLGGVESIKGVVSIDDDSSDNDPFSQAYIIRFGKTVKGDARAKAIKHVEKMFQSRQRFDVKVTDRVLDEKHDKVKASLRPVTIPQILIEWVDYRLKLEQAACKYWVTETDKEIRWNEVMRLAIAKLDLIFRAVRNDKLNDEQLVAEISKGIKVSFEEADNILKRNLRQLRKLEDLVLVAKIKELQERKKELEGRIKAPGKYVLTDLERLVKELT